MSSPFFYCTVVFLWAGELKDLSDLHVWETGLWPNMFSFRIKDCHIADWNINSTTEDEDIYIYIIYNHIYVHNSDLRRSSKVHWNATRHWASMDMAVASTFAIPGHWITHIHPVLLFDSVSVTRIIHWGVWFDLMSIAACRLCPSLISQAFLFCGPVKTV